MLNRETYKALLQEIVDLYFPDEAVAFKVGGDKIVRAAMTKDQSRGNEPLNRRYGVDWGTTKTILEIVVVAFNAWKVLKELQTVRKEKSLQQDLDRYKEFFENELEKALVENNISRKKATAIAAHIWKRDRNKE